MGATRAVRQIPNSNYRLTYGKYRERTRAATALMTGKWARFLSWVRQGDNAAGMTPYPGWRRAENALYYLALHYVALLCKQPPRARACERPSCIYAHLRTGVIYQLAVCVSPLSREIVTQLWVVVHELRLVFPSKLVNHSTRRLDAKNTSLAWSLIIHGYCERDIFYFIHIYLATFKPFPITFAYVYVYIYTHVVSTILGDKQIKFGFNFNPTRHHI